MTTRLPVHSALFKQHIGELVVRWWAGDHQRIPAFICILSFLALIIFSWLGSIIGGEPSHTADKFVNTD
jgi:hypothetical protein